MESLNINREDIEQQLRSTGEMPSELAEVFGEEAELHLRMIYDGLDRLRVDLSDGDALRAVCNSSHTLKGAASVLGLSAIGGIASRVEAFSETLIEHNGSLDDAKLHLLLDATDLIQDMTLQRLDFDDATNRALSVHSAFDAIADACTGADKEEDTVESVGTQEVEGFTDESGSASETGHIEPAHRSKSDYGENAFACQVKIEWPVELDDGSPLDDLPKSDPNGVDQPPNEASNDVEESPAQPEQANSLSDDLFGDGFETEMPLACNNRPWSELFDDGSDHAAPLCPASPQTTTQANDASKKSTASVELCADGNLAERYEAEIAEVLANAGAISPELSQIFLEEAEEHLQSIYAGLERMSASAQDVEALATVRRSTHTIKGAAGAVGMLAVCKLTHRMEDLLDHLADHRRSATQDQIRLMLMTADRVQEMTTGELNVAETARALAELYLGFDSHMSALEGERHTEANSEVPSPVANALVTGEAIDPAEPLPEAQAFVEPVPEVTSTSSSGVEEPRSPANSVAASAAPKPKSPDSNESGEPTQTSVAAKSEHYLRVPLERVDGLLSLIGEMVVNRSAFHQRLADFEARIEDMQVSVSRFRSVAHDVETRYSVEALQTGALKESASPGNDFGLKLSSSNGSANARNSKDLDSLEFDRYTEFHLLARSLSEATNDVSVVTSELKNLYGDLEALLGRQQRFNRDAQDSLMQIRMVPLSNIVNRLERTVRSVSNRLGKRVDLQVVGGSTELDKTVLEEITDPLLHLLRNGLDHGIETPDERLRCGKPDRSQLKIEALHQGTQVTIRVIDDGRGLDLDKIRSRAIERGIVSDRDELTSESLSDLIFAPGFSTAESLTEISGRGVGMDIVRDAVQRLKGSIQVASRPGEGCTFTIHLPTSLAVTRALLVESCGHSFAIPMQSVQQIMRFDPESVFVAGNSDFIQVGEQTLPIKDLTHSLEMRQDGRPNYAKASPLLLIRSGDSQVALTVDVVHGGQDIVVKTLGDHLRSVPGYLGATLAGDGTVIPILDPADLCGQTRVSPSNRNNTQSVSSIVRCRTVMVIDDSLSVRRVTTNLMRSHGWEVLEAKDGVDALECLAVVDVPPDAFLCDMEMPRMDGLELVSRIRTQPEFATTPVVMVTSRAGQKHRRLSAEAGANEHVVKPFNDEDLVELVTRLVAEHRELVLV